MPCYITYNYGTTGMVIKRQSTNKLQFRGGAAPWLLPFPCQGRAGGSPTAPARASHAKGPALPCSSSSKRILQLQPRWKVLQETPSGGRRHMSSGDEVQRGTCHEQHKGMVNIFPPSPRLFCSLSELDMSAPYLATETKCKTSPAAACSGSDGADGEPWRRKKSRTFKNKLHLIQRLK